MSAKEIFQKEVLEEIKSIAREISQVQSFAGLLSHQQKIQNLYEKYIFLKQLTTSKYQQILENVEVKGYELERKEDKRDFYGIPKEDSKEKEENKMSFDKERKKDEVDKEKDEVSEVISIEEEKELDKKEIIEKESFVKEEGDKIKPLNIQIAEIKPVEKGQTLNPIKLDFNDSIAFISQLFNGSKSDMDAEFKLLNQTQTVEEAKKWMENMFAKYNWRNKEEFVERLSGLIVQRFGS